MSKAVSGPSKGQELKLLAAEHMTWQAWRAQHPDGSVLSTNTGHRRDYRRIPYTGYEKSEQLMFPVRITREELPRKAWVLGVVSDGEAIAFPVDQLPDGKTVTATLGKRRLKVIWDAQSRHPSVTDAVGKPLPGVMSYWFAWQAFYPQTRLWSAES